MRRRFSSCGLRFGSAARCGLRTASASSIARRDASEDYMKLHRKDMRHGALCLPFKWCANMNMVTPDNLFCRAHAGARRHALDRSTPPGPQPLNDQAPATDLILLNRSPFPFWFSKSYRSLSHPIAAASPISDSECANVRTDLPTAKIGVWSIARQVRGPSCTRWLALHRSASSLRTPPLSETSRRASPPPPA